MVYLKINISNFHIALLLWLLHLSVGSAAEMKRNCADLKDSSCHHHISLATSNKLKWRVSGDGCSSVLRDSISDIQTA